MYSMACSITVSMSMATWISHRVNGRHIFRLFSLTINDCPGQQGCSRLVPVFLAAIYGDANAIGHVSGRRLIKLMMELLELGDADLKIERAGGRKCLVSTQLFERQHGVAVRVKLAVVLRQLSASGPGTIAGADRGWVAPTRSGRWTSCQTSSFMAVRSES
jgi:hypothetical protein